MIANGSQSGDVFGGADAAFGDHHDVLWRDAGELDQQLGVDGKRAQIAAVDADEIEAERDGALHLLAVVGLAEHVEADAVGFVAQVAEGSVRVGGDDEQNGVGAGGAGFEDLKGIEDEVLAETGNVDDVGGLFEIGERALEELFVGEDGERGGSGGLEGAGQGGGMEVAADEPLGGRGFFDFGDDRGAGLSRGCGGRR